MDENSNSSECPVHEDTCGIYKFCFLHDDHCGAHKHASPWIDGIYGVEDLNEVAWSWKLLRSSQIQGQNKKKYLITLVFRGLNLQIKKEQVNLASFPGEGLGDWGSEKGIVSPPHQGVPEAQPQKKILFWSFYIV